MASAALVASAPPLAGATPAPSTTVAPSTTTSPSTTAAPTTSTLTSPAPADPGDPGDPDVGAAPDAPATRPPAALDGVAARPEVTSPPIDPEAVPGTGVPAGDPAPTAEATGRAVTVIDRGHVDIGAVIEGGQLRIRIKDDTVAGPAVLRSPGDVVLHALPASRTEVPANPAFGFLGTPGTARWILPQVQDPALLWPGWNTEALAPGSIDGPMRWTLDRVDGPGAMWLFTTDQFGSPRMIFDSAALPATLAVPRGTHAHGTWAFAAEGTYRLHMSMEVSTPDGVLRASDVVTFTVGSQRLPTPPGSESTPAPGGPGTPGGSDATPGGSANGADGGRGGGGGTAGNGSSDDAGGSGAGARGGAVGTSGSAGAREPGIDPLPEAGGGRVGLGVAGLLLLGLGLVLVRRSRSHRSR
ncbi:MAG: choice-of-anchor M domain-containing protein [Acidimicrobiia bacterium]|nr:choice-of-anchor M domain-containing protein [Acidimicrobiia bacterium]